MSVRSRRILSPRRALGPMPGRLLAAAVLLGSCGAGLAYTADPARMWDAVGKVGFELNEIKLSGQRHTSDSAIIAAIGLGPGMTLLGLDIDAARERLEALPWVRQATLRKALPRTLIVDIEEDEAYARWRTGGREVLISRDGQVLADSVAPAFRGLPLVAGREANSAAEGVRDVLVRFPSVDKRVAAAIRVNDRRWDLRLYNGATVRLPEENPEAALVRLASLEERGALLGVGDVVVDMRLADRTTVRLKAAGAEEDEGERPQLPTTVAHEDPLAAAIAEARNAALDPLARAILEYTP